MNAFLSGRFLALVATLLLAAAIGFFAWSGFKAPPLTASSGIVTTPPGWVKLAGPGFTLYAPAGAQLRAAQGNGFTYGDIVGTALCIRFQAGGKAKLMLSASHPDISETALTIAGAPAIVRKAYLADNEQRYWFAGCGQPLYSGLLLTTAEGAIAIEVSAANQDSLDDAMMLFKSVRLASGG